MGDSVARDLQSTSAIGFRTRLTYRYEARHARVEWVTVRGAEYRSQQYLQRFRKSLDARSESIVG